MVFGDVVDSIFAGTLAGIVGKLYEFPFDTIKVRVQYFTDRYSGYADCGKQIFREGGIRALYAGFAAPVAGAGLENAVCFGAFRIGLRVYEVISGSSTTDCAQCLPITAAVTCGSFAGVGSTVVLTPLELVKSKMQVQLALPPDRRIYRGVFDCARQLILRNGVTAIFNGGLPTLAREVPGNAAWFGTYHAVVNWFTLAGQAKEDLSAWKIAMAGAIGGASYWTIFFPADVVKTRMQINSSVAGHAAQTSLWRGIGVLYRREGFHGLYSGWSITMVRAIPANAALFFLYERVFMALQRVSIFK